MDDMVCPAEPMLASALWTSYLTGEGNEVSTEGTVVGTGCRSVDNALNGGLHYGEVTCLSGVPDSGVQELALAFLTSHLLSSSDAVATVIDTGSSFDVRRLHTTITNGMQDQSNASGKAIEILSRLNIMKVFDFVGLTESLTELRDNIGHEAHSDNLPKAPRGTVGDSEDEAEDEMLDDPIRKKSASRGEYQPSQARLLIIDNIAQCAVPVSKNNYVRGQALLSSFMRSLRHLTQQHRLCTIIVNGVTSSSKDEAPSIFSSCSLRPALGKSFAYMLDTHILVHQLRRSAAAAQAPHHQGHNATGLIEVSESISVLEVLHSRYHRGGENWATFELKDGWKVVPAG